MNAQRLFLSIFPAIKDEVKILKIRYQKGGKINYYKKYIIIKNILNIKLNI